MKLVASTCPGQFTGGSVLFEPPKDGQPAGPLASPCLVQVVRCTVYVPVVNVGMTEVLLYCWTGLGTLGVAQVVCLPAGVTDDESMLATVSSQVTTSLVPDRIESLDLSALTEEEQTGVKLLLHRYHSVFSAHDGDLGCTNLMPHDIPLLDDVIIQQWYRRIPPSEYEAVKAHIN